MQRAGLIHKPNAKSDRSKDVALRSPLDASLAPTQTQHPAMTLQLSIGNQAVLRMVRQQSAERSLPACSGTSWDFSLIPIYPPERGVAADRPSVSAAPPPIQPKLEIGAVDDPLEHEADRVADHVMRMPDRGVAVSSAPAQASRQCAPCGEDDELQMKPAAGIAAKSIEIPAAVHDVLRSSGLPLDRTVRADLEPRFGHDFSRVRVHTGALADQSARDLNANAYTVGRHIVFAARQYAPGTATGRRLLSHELAHVVQQSRHLVPESAAVQRQAKPAPQAVPTIQGDVPGDNPQSYLPPPYQFSAEIRFDGDGDQYKELVLDLVEKEFWPSSSPGSVGPVKRLLVKIVQISSGQARQAEFTLPLPSFGGQLFPLVREVTDGRGPTRIALVTNATNQVLELFPPERTAAGVSYLASVMDQRFSFDFPAERGEIHKVASEPGTSSVIGGILFKEMDLGAYQDHFALTVRPTSTTQAQFGLSLLSDGAPVDTKGADIKINGPIRYAIVDTGPTSFGLDLDGDNKADLIVFDRLTTPESIDGGGPPDKNRDHRLRVTGTAIGADQFFDFKVRDGRPVGGAFNPANADKNAESNALAVRTLERQARSPTLENQLDSAEQSLVKLRVLSKETFEAWRALSAAMIRLKPQTSKTVDAALQDEAAKAASRFYSLLKAETAGMTQFSGGRGGISSYNPYTGTSTLNDRTFGAGVGLEADLRAGQWDKSIAAYEQLVAGLDRWIADQTTEKRGSSAGAEAARQASVKQNLQDIQRYQPKRLLAVFHPDEKFKSEAGYIAELPLELYYWRDGDTWHIKDLTNATKTFEYTAKALAGEPEPPISLLMKLNDPDHFPVGRIHYEVHDAGGGAGGVIQTTDYLTWKKFLTYLSLGLAAAGLTAVTFGTGTVAVAGAWALGSSAVLGALSAGIDLAEHVQQGNLDTQTAVLDLTQIVAGLAGAGAVASGAIVRSAAAAPASARWAGAWANTAMFAGRVYLPVTRTAAVADVVTFAILAPDSVKQLQDIQTGPGEQADKNRAKLLLLGQIAVLGGLTALSAKGLIADPAKLPTLVLHPGPEGVPVVSTALTANSVVLDTNVASAFEIRARNPAELHEGHKARIKAIEGIPDADLRVADPTLGGVGGEKGRTGQPVTQKGIGVIVDRASPEYQSFLANLSDASDPVGGKKPNAPIDRAIIADTAFAVTEPGVTPRYASADKGTYNPLARRAGIKLTSQPIPDRFPLGFDVNIGGKTITVIPLK
jgi:hypothetical protein